MAIPIWVSVTGMAIAAASVLYMMRQIQKNPGAAPWSDDEESVALLAGTIENWPSKDQLATMLNEAGLEPNVGAHAIRLTACPSFVFRDFDGPVAPSISADHESVEGLRDITAKVSQALEQHGIRHRLEVYDADGECVAKFGSA